ncbi:TPA: hypothetical protein N0F65_010576 [Lagenidium giganteum]|uniref:N-acetyltransferase domain-containing protein n=1 Tax=Lagenidium giganteum TaxID=4803 RepID=A0AAV2ZAF6_9STRA|nr:TPA: hypothetical protein N0F65_010576 [Lagenidium giganteum]
MTQLIIRPLTQADIPAIVSQLSGEERENATARYEKKLTQPLWDCKTLNVFVAEDVETHEIVGNMTAGCWYPGYFPKLADDVRQHRSHGYGTKMIQWLHDQAKAQGVHVFRAECEKGPLVAFYGRAGLEPVPYKGEHPGYPDSHQMLECWLDQPEKKMIEWE